MPDLGPPGTRRGAALHRVEHLLHLEPYRIEAGDRVAQLVVVPVALPAPVEVDELPEAGDGRGAGGFGSSGA